MSGRAVLLCALCGLLLAGAAWAQAPASAHRQEPRKLESASGGQVDAIEGWLSVPERRDTASRTIEIHYLRLKSRARTPRAPLVYLAGGPGQRGVDEDAASVGAWARYLDVCDVVLLDQRGTRDPALGWRWDGPLPLAFFVSEDSARAHLVEMSRRAAAAIRARGVDLAGYNTVENAEDLESLRVALGAEKLSLLGFSYGTHLACAYLRRHPERVESAVLAGLEGPDHTYKLPLGMDRQFERLSAHLASDARMHAGIPDLVALLDRVSAKLSASPMLVRIPAPGGASVELPVGVFGLRYILRADLGDATDLPVFPRLLASIEQGDASLLTWFIAKRAPGLLAISGMNAAMDCASGVTPARLATIEAQARQSRFGDLANFPYPAIVPAWNVPDLGDHFRAPLVTEVRTLVLSGEWDFNTPPAQAAEVLAGFRNATHLVVPNAGHEQILFQNNSTPAIVHDFLAGADVRKRKPEYPPLRFVPLPGMPDNGVRHPSAGR